MALSTPGASPAGWSHRAWPAPSLPQYSSPLRTSRICPGLPSRSGRPAAPPSSPASRECAGNLTFTGVGLFTVFSTSAAGGHPRLPAAVEQANVLDAPVAQNPPDAGRLGGADPRRRPPRACPCRCPGSRPPSPRTRRPCRRRTLWPSRPRPPPRPWGCGPLRRPSRPRASRRTAWEVRLTSTTSMSSCGRA